MCLAAIGRVIEVRTEHGVLLAEVAFDEKTMTVGAPFTPDVRPGMFVVVHAGLALEVLDPDRAAEAIALRAQITAADAPTDT
jgi:hydrogenase expression/formation protein HypC